MMDYKKINKESWNDRVDIHVKSDFYDVPGFIAGKNSLKQPELDLLGDVSGKSILHLQCHFGQDSISLARMGAHVTGVDISDAAIEAAQELNDKCDTNVRFVTSDVYSLPGILNEQFDIVFTSYGTIGWLPDMNKWASVVSHFMNPGGKFVFVEFHPAVWMFDNDHNEVFYRYFNSDPIVETYSGTYAQKDSDIQIKAVSWNHGLAEVIGSLLDQGLHLKTIEEFDYSPYNCFNGMQEDEPGKYRIRKFGDKMPLMYALTALKS